MFSLRLNLFILIILASGHYSSGQHQLQDLQISEAVKQLREGNVNTNEFIYGVPISIGSVMGDTYSSNTWNLTSLLLNDGNMLEGYYTKYDIYSDELNIISHGNEVKVISGNLIDSFIMRDSVDHSIHYFTNSLKFINSNLKGFTEITCDGAWKLLENTVIVTRSPTYNYALDVGDKNTRILKDRSLYLLINENVYPVKNKKDILEQVDPTKKELVRAYMKKNKKLTDSENYCDLLNFIEHIP